MIRNIIANNISCQQILSSSNISKNILHDLHLFIHSCIEKNGTYKTLGTVPVVGPEKKYSLNI